MMEQSERTVSTIRMFVPALAGVLLARLAAAVPTVAEAIRGIDGVFAEAGMTGISVLVVVQSVLTAAVISGYYWIVRRFGDRWPLAEWLLGSPRTPSYVPRHAKRN